MYAKFITEDNRFAFSITDNGGVVITDQEHASLMSAQANGKVIVSDGNGRPIAAMPAAPTDAQKTELANAAIKQQIAFIESTRQPRAIREYALSGETAYLAEVDMQIASLRSELISDS